MRLLPAYPGFHEIMVRIFRGMAGLRAREPCAWVQCHTCPIGPELTAGCYWLCTCGDLVGHYHCAGCFWPPGL